MNNNQFFWFMGIVEDREDPLQIGRVRVRTLEQTHDKTILPTHDLPWAQVVVNNSASMNDIGVSATGYVEGSLVVGFYIDGPEKQKPMILGSIPGFPENIPDENFGHSDPRGIYPVEVKRPDMNSLARTRTILNDLSPNLTGPELEDYSYKALHPSIRLRNSHVDDLIGEPIPERKTTYPYSKVMETESGHIEEFDDTLGYERICRMHRTGTMQEMHSDGNMVTHVTKDNYSVIMGNDSIRVRGNVEIYVDGNVYTYVRGNADMQVEGDFTHNIKGDYILDVGGNMSITTDGFYHLESKEEIWNITNSSFLLNSKTGINGSTDGTFFLHSKNNFDVNTNSNFTLKSVNSDLYATNTFELFGNDINLHAENNITFRATNDVDLSAGKDAYVKGKNDLNLKSTDLKFTYSTSSKPHAIYVATAAGSVGELSPSNVQEPNQIKIFPANPVFLYNSQPLNPISNFVYERELKLSKKQNNIFSITGVELFTEYGTGGTVKTTATNNDKSRGLPVFDGEVYSVEGKKSNYRFDPNVFSSESKNKIKNTNNFVAGTPQPIGPNNPSHNGRLSSERFDVLIEPFQSNEEDTLTRPHNNTLDVIHAIKDLRVIPILGENVIYNNNIWQERIIEHPNKKNKRGGTLKIGNNKSVGIDFMWDYIGLPWMKDYKDPKYGDLGIHGMWCAGFASFVLMLSGNKIKPTASVFKLIEQARAGELGEILIDSKGKNLGKFPSDIVRKGDLILMKQNDKSHVTFFDGYNGNGKWIGVGGNQNHKISSTHYGAEKWVKKNGQEVEVHDCITLIVRPQSPNNQNQPLAGVVGFKFPETSIV